VFDQPSQPGFLPPEGTFPSADAAGAHLPFALGEIPSAISGADEVPSVAAETSAAVNNIPAADDNASAVAANGPADNAPAAVDEQPQASCFEFSISSTCSGNFKCETSIASPVR